MARPGDKRMRRIAVAAAVVGVLMALAACAPHPTWPPPGLGAGPSAHPTPTALPAGPPQRLRIPAIGLDWPVVPVGLDADGAMDAPQGAPDSAVWHEGFWWRGGYRVGDAGNAVIAGHVDDDAGALTTFARIADLRPGDTLLVTLAGGGVVTFRVERVARLPVPVGGPNDPTMRALFGPATTPRLNLITCAGAWASGGFDERLVVYTTRV